jgi:magnesium chelatase family protein
MPIGRVTVNLAPADNKKEGSILDLAIAVGLLKSSSQMLNSFNDAIFLGELGLDGKLRKADGILPILISARNAGYKKFIIPKVNEKESSFISDIEIVVEDICT